MLLSPSGGLVYHWRSLRHGHRWKTFSKHLSLWLGQWNCRHDHLLLIGPSAGYTLPTPWLKTFAKISAYDLDSLAGPLFRLRHGRLPITFHKVDVFHQNERLTCRRLRSIMELNPDATVLFANVLGQLLVGKNTPEEEWRSFLNELRTTLARNDWASYHDTYTEKPGMIIDHLTDGPWTRDLAKENMTWDLTPTSRHNIQAVRGPKIT